MYRVKFILILIIVIMLPVSGSAYAAGRNLTIVFSGDMRGELENCHCPKEDFGGLARRFKYISEVRKEVGDLLLLDVGDVLPLLSHDNNRRKILTSSFISFKAMEMMEYDAMNVGESDLILGERFLKEKEDTLLFPLISANIIDRDTDGLFFKPYVIKTMPNGLKVGILGLLNERYVINSDRLQVMPHKDAASKFISELRQKTDVVIVLGHLGLPYSLELANSVRGIDLILSGHWDTESQEPIEVGNTLIMPTAYYSRKIGRLDLEISGGSISSYEWHSIPLDKRYDGATIIENLVSKSVGKAEKKRTQNVQIEKISEERPLRVFVFLSPGCRACMEVERDLLPVLAKKYGKDILVKLYDITVPDNYEQMVRLERLYGVKGGYVPEVIVGGNVLMGKEEIFSRLDSVIQKSLKESFQIKKNNEFIKSQAAQYHPPARDLILHRFESFGIYTVMVAGLLDGINPCAFSTIVFFISFLALAGYRKREMLYAGTSFTLAVFIAYLLIGLGIFRFLRALSSFSYLVVTINILISMLAFLLGILSLVDYYRFKKTGNISGIMLKLPQVIKNRIHSVIGADFRLKRGTFFRILWIAFTAGLMVSLLESFCTGQVYLPTIAFVLRMPGKRIPALLYLILYNLLFILPLIAVFLLGFLGVTSRAFSHFMERHLGLVKLSTATLFFVLGAAILIFQ